MHLNLVIGISTYGTVNMLLIGTANILKLVKILIKQSEKGSPTVAERRVPQDKWLMNSQIL